MVLSGKHGIMKFPEFFLIVGAEGSFRRFLRMGMHGGQRKLAIDEADLVGITLFDSLQGWVQPAAVWAFEIGKFDNRHRCFFRTMRRVPDNCDIGADWIE